MADPRVKQKGPDRGMTPEQIRRERDLIDQVNKRSNTQDSAISELQARTEMRIIASGRVSTNGAGGFSRNLSRGCIVTISGAEIIITLDSARPQPLHYAFSGSYQTAGYRVPMVSTYTATMLGVTAKNDAGGTVSASTNALNLQFTVVDYD